MIICFVHFVDQNKSAELLGFIVQGVDYDERTLCI